jgi:hypothetical protein
MLTQQWEAQPNFHWKNICRCRHNTKTFREKFAWEISLLAPIFQYRTKIFNEKIFRSLALISQNQKIIAQKISWKYLLKQNWVRKIRAIIILPEIQTHVLAINRKLLDMLAMFRLLKEHVFYLTENGL